MIKAEEEAFNKTLDRGLESFQMQELLKARREGANDRHLLGEFAFKLYDTYGFPLDLTELMARERGLSVDTPVSKS